MGSLRLGYRCTFCLSAREAIESVNRYPDGVDIVVTDYNMPGMSGLDLVRALAGIRPGLPVMISSGYVCDELLARALGLGVFAVMQKERTLGNLAPWRTRRLGTGRPIWHPPTERCRLGAASGWSIEHVDDVPQAASCLTVLSTSLWSFRCFRRVRFSTEHGRGPPRALVSQRSYCS